MRFRKTTLAEMTQRITQLGLDQCKICGSGTLLVHKRPGLVSFGGEHYGKDDPRNDPEANVLFMLMTSCDLCGNTQFFDAERLHSPDEKTLVVGMTEEEEDERYGG